MKIWLDDVREMPDGYDFWAKNGDDAMLEIASGLVEKISFDHDLGLKSPTGYDVAKAIEHWAYYKIIPPLAWEIHSANPVGRKNIEQAMKSAEKYWSGENHVCTCNPYQLENYGCVCKK